MMSFITGRLSCWEANDRQSGEAGSHGSDERPGSLEAPPKGVPQGQIEGHPEGHEGQLLGPSSYYKLQCSELKSLNFDVD